MDFQYWIFLYLLQPSFDFEKEYTYSMWEAAIITIQAVTSCMPKFAWEHTQRMWEGAIIPFQTTIDHEEFARLHIIHSVVSIV